VARPRTTYPLELEGAPKLKELSYMGKDADQPRNLAKSVTVE
jgi:glucosamine 6-phosphate synthetase-like amidotransferase/phosphosugar isomerase protein